jgi:hypothetical protein
MFSNKKAFVSILKTNQSLSDLLFPNQYRRKVLALLLTTESYFSTF